MTVEDIDISKALEQAKTALAEQKDLSPAFRSSMELLFLVVSLLVKRLGRNSRNSSIPPSQDPNRAKKKKAAGEVVRRKPGGQEKHIGCTLEKRETPDEIEEILIDRRTIPAEACIGRWDTKAGKSST